MNQAPTEMFVGIGAVAAALGVCPSTIRVWEKLGRIPRALRVGGHGRRLYRVDDLVAIREAVNEMNAAGRQRGGSERAADLVAIRAHVNQLRQRSGSERAA